MKTLFTCLVATVFVPGLLAAQADDAVAVRVAAINYLQREVGRVPIILEPRDMQLTHYPDHRIITEVVGKDGIRTDADNRDIVELTGVSLRKLSDAVKCQSGRNPDCTIDGGAAMLALDRPTIDGDHATMLAQVSKEGGRRGTLHVRTFQLMLRKRDGTWVVEQARVILET